MKNIYKLITQPNWKMQLTNNEFPFPSLGNFDDLYSYGAFVRKDKADSKDSFYEASISLAGTPKSEIEAWIEDDVFHVKTKIKTYQVYIPDTFNKDSVNLKYQDGILKITFDEKKKNVKKISF